MASSVRAKRLMKELSELSSAAPSHISIYSAARLDRWLIKLHGAEHTLYAGDEFLLLFKFPDNYPIEAPEVTFSGTAPVHPHVYSNGHICLSILYDHWSPALTVESVCLSILSMLSSCEKKKLPKTNRRYVWTAKGSPKDTAWVFDDDQV